MTQPLAIATTSPLAAQAGEVMARLGGNAIDAAIAATLVSINTEPGVCSLGCGGYMTIWPPGKDPLTLDGYVAVPGKGATDAKTSRNSTEVHLEYGGGVTTVVGPDSIGVPGGVALLGVASRTFGRLPWQELFGPAVNAVNAGFPLPEASYHYLKYSGKPIFGGSADGFAALHDADGTLKRAGDTIRVPHLADTLERIARLGAEEFYTGAIGQAMARYCRDAGGRLGADDLASYEVLHRPSLKVDCRDWRIATNPPPAIGGVVLAAMLTMLGQSGFARWDRSALKVLVDVQRAVLDYRRERLDLSERISEDAARLLDLAQVGDLSGIIASGSTCHTSVVDASGLACAVTMSAGYGSGDMPPDTGVWLNNCVGELELNKAGLDVGPPGIRLRSNMAPTAARDTTGAIMAIGSPGADRITTAILQALVNYLILRMPLAEAIAHPRAHVEFGIEFGPDRHRVAYERGLPVAELGVPCREFESLSMFFGGVGAAIWSPERGFAVAADPRRNGGVWSTVGNAGDSE